LWNNRRFVLGKGLIPSSSFKHFTAQAVGLHGNEMLIPKSINRLRVRGAGSRLVDIFKNFMANKSFSRGIETLGAEASMAFVGNTQQTVSPLPMCPLSPH